MKQYQVLSGQNIYDVAILLYGNIEGVFDLLLCNPGINLKTTLEGGMVLDYHEEFVMNQAICEWISEKQLNIRNGELDYAFEDVDTLIKDHIHKEHPEIIEELSRLTADELNLYWMAQSGLKMVIKQSGQSSTFTFRLHNDKHLMVDWGDATRIQIFEGSQLNYAEHYYQGGGEHIIKIYGDFSCSSLDFTELNGVYYPVNYIYAERFITPLSIPNQDKLIITNEKY